MKKILLILMLILCSALALAINTSNCPDNMVSYWTFDNSSNPGKDDYNGNDGLVSRAVWVSSGRLGGALVLSREIYTNYHYYIQIPTNVSPTGYQPFTMEGWYYFDSLAGLQTFWFKGDNLGTDDYQMMFNKPTNVGVGEIHLFSNGADNKLSVKTDNIFQTGQWYHVVVTYDGGTNATSIKVYVNGTQVSTTDISVGNYTGIHNSTLPLLLGATLRQNSKLDNFRGAMDDIAYYDVDLNATTILEHYNEGFGINYCEDESTQTYYGPVRYVDCLNGDDNNNGNITNPLKTISEGLSRSTFGDKVYVFSGTCVENVSVGRFVDLEGENKSNTIIEGTITISDSGSKVSGFTVTGPGDGIRNPVFAANNVIYNNIIKNNEGDGIMTYHFFDGSITNCLIVNNSGWGFRKIGDCYPKKCKHYLINTTISNNNGGGISFSRDSIITFNDSILALNGNTNLINTLAGGGVYLAYSNIFGPGSDVDFITDLGNNSFDNPYLADIDNGDYRLSCDSPAVDSDSNGLNMGYYKTGCVDTTYAGPVWYVDCDNGNDSNDGSINNPLKTITEASSRAAFKQTIHVFSSTCSENPSISNSVHLEGEDRSNTTINGTATISSGSAISDFTITGPGNGVVADGASFVYNNIIKQNSGFGVGGSLHDAIINNNLIIENSNYGIIRTGDCAFHFSEGCKVFLYNTTVTNNEGGIFLARNSRFYINDSIISLNGNTNFIESPLGGGNIFLSYSNVYGPGSGGGFITDLGNNSFDDPYLADIDNGDYQLLCVSPAVDSDSNGLNMGYYKTGCTGPYFICKDEDGDGYNSTSECNGGSPADCNDYKDEVYPGAFEICDGLDDNDCDGYNDSVDTNCSAGSGTGSWSSMVYPEGVYEPYAEGLSTAHKFNLNIEFVDMNSTGENYLLCYVNTGDNLKTIVDQLPTLSNTNYTLNYTIPTENGIVKDDTVHFIPWKIQNCTLMSGSTNVYSDSKVYNLNKKIHTHFNQWYAFTDSNADAYRALDCYLGFPNSYFNNTVKCDYEGDVAFALAMSKGLSIETNCYDGIDNDNNGQTDCEDRYCKGISYTCKTHENITG